MNQFKTHVPRFIDAPRTVIDFDTQEDLLNLDFLQVHVDESFSYWALSDNRLMAVLDEGLTWRVAGTIKYLNEITLPRWEPKYKAKMLDGSIEILENGEVVSSRGDRLTLRDGTIVENVK